jgi:DNA segregation ATPase FtsK/SpoIIIE, S-DNA-T family
MAKATAAKRAASRRDRTARASFGSVLLQECIGLAILGLAALSAVALWSHDARDPVLAPGPVENVAGVLGALLASALYRSLGYGSLLAVAALATIGGRLVAGRGLPRLTSRFWSGAAILLVAVATLPLVLPSSAGIHPRAPEAGALGRFLAAREIWLVGSWGALVLNVTLLSIGALSVTGVSAGRMLGAVGVALGWLGAGAAALALRLWEAAVQLVAAGVRAVSQLLGGLERGWQALAVRLEQRKRRARVAAARRPLPPPQLETLGGAAAQVVPSASAVSTSGARRHQEPQIIDHSAERLQQRRAQQEVFPFEERESTSPYRRPDISIFRAPPESARAYDHDSLIMNSRILEKKLSDFGVGGSVVKVHPGPVITMYEFAPASGVKVNKIVGLSDDLALALRAMSVRIIAPLPGKSVVGVEVANSEHEVVYLRDLLECDHFRESKSLLPVALGKDIYGNPADADLAKMPHLLVAGATGTGKSVFLNSLLCSILFRFKPDELKLLLVDPKLLELSVYAGIPHLIADVVTNPKRASAALGGVVRKMEERYQLMAALGVRSIQQYNERCAREQEAGNKTFRLKPKPGEDEGVEVAYQKFPYIVVVIDELADLMVVSAKDVEESLQRLAQMARAAGIHLVLATQRPSVDVLTGIIKANFPARISFQVSSRTDSRTILDQNGAEHLLGSGDMLFLPPGTSKMQRLHGAFVSEGEVAALTKFLGDQGAPNFDDDLTAIDVDVDDARDPDDDVDEMYDQAVRLVAETRNASISYVQRRLKVGYNRAARMIEHMEKEGVVGPQNGTKPRDVYISAIQP